eukprot:CAMPEP_0204827248 /NCGR_PEP_ID=MMETSP1346-20131115/4758_1 /ASSEMBLY_ACC=CAM_ASM_000771 /TAXON_ID=215587 /ORGANISM="Aplanochytrium stocchinoi, Strain GSBS06" /LENGTH=589 /DNA_ID=CAMNT_0051955601 /DNA_START=584 /DNA_END=2353 /DNA_ORIENTATION=+
MDFVKAHPGVATALAYLAVNSILDDDNEEGAEQFKPAATDDEFLYHDGSERGEENEEVQRPEGSLKPVEKRCYKCGDTHPYIRGQPFECKTTTKKSVLSPQIRVQKPQEKAQKAEIKTGGKNIPTPEEETAYVLGLISRAREAQKVAEGYSQEEVDRLIRGLVWSCAKDDSADAIAQLAVAESSLGNYSGKLTKISKKTRAALMDIINDKSVGVIEEDTERCIVKIAKPVGVIGAISPSTNPEATPVIKAINAIKGRNSVVISPSSKTKKTNKLIVDKMREALVKMGAPADLVIGIDQPSRVKTNVLLQNCDLGLATGGSAIVKAAYSSGRPALGVGVGNAVIVVDETANVEDAAKKIRISKTFDLAASCSSDNSVVVVEKLYDTLLNALIAEGGYLANSHEYEKIAAVLWNEKGNLNGKAVVKAPQVLCKMAGIDLPEDRTFIIMPETGVGREYPYSGEKLSVVMAYYKVKNFDEAVVLTNRIQEYQGKGHSCGIYSNNDENVIRFGLETKTSRVMVNQPQSISNSGNLWNGMPQTFSLGCGTWGGNSTTENINWRHLVNITWLSKPLPVPKTLPSDNELFGADIIEM